MLFRTLVKTAVASAVAVTAMASTAMAEWTPEKPIEIVVGFAPGGGTDQTARLIASASQDLFPVPLVVVNRPGASGTLAAELVANAEPDGYTLLVAGGSESTSVPNHSKTNYSLDQFRGVIRVNREHMVIASKAGSGLKTIEDVVERAKANPGELTYGSSGPGGILHSAMLVFSKEAGIDMKHVPYKGGAPQLAALLGGHIDLAVLAPSDAAVQQQAGTVNALATTSDTAPQLPDTPSLRDLGYDVNLENMKGLVAPAGTPDEVIAYLHDRFKQAMEREGWERLAAKAKIQSAYLNGADFEKAMRDMSDAIADALGTGGSQAGN